MAVRALLHLAHKTLVCSVCYNLFQHPVSFPCGHVFCKSCAERCVDERPQCPLCNRAVSSKRASTPVPTLAALTTLVQDVAHSLRLHHTNTTNTTNTNTNTNTTTTTSASTTSPNTTNINTGSSTPPPLLHLGEAASTVKMTENRSTTASVDTSDIVCSPTSGDDDKTRTTPEISRCGSMSNTQLLHTPLFRRRLTTAEELTWDGGETQLVHSASPTRSMVHSCTAVCRYNINNIEKTPEHGGCCVLCGLDIKNRAQMHRYLRRLLNTDPSCNRDHVRQLNELALGTCLGPMWDLHVPQIANMCTTETSEKTGGISEDGMGINSGRRKRSREEGNQLSTTTTILRLEVHQRCLEWCLLHDHIKDDDTILQLMISNNVLQELSGVETTTITICSFCANSGICLLLCGYCQRKAYHYPCALLTGVDVCDISAGVSRLLCAECAREQ